METPLARDEVIAVVAGRGCARRVPVLLHQWTYPGAFKERAAEVQQILERFPQDAQVIFHRPPEIFVAPPDDPEYRWVNHDAPPATGAEHGLDEQAAIRDWSELDGIVAHFPSPDYPGLFQSNPPPDGRYRMAHWWYGLFERHWSLRGMTNALMDYYTNPEEVHRLFRAYTDFYLRFIERSRDEIGADAIYLTDDLGTQTGLFFSPDLFDLFFKPYYAEIIAKAHALGLQVWLHSCGNIRNLLPSFIALGLDVIHPIQKYAMDEADVAKTFGGQIAIWAGFDVQRIIPYGSPDDVRREVRHLMDTYARQDGRFLITAGNGITPDTPIPSLEALFEEAYSYGAQVVKKWRPGGPSSR